MANNMCLEILAGNSITWNSRFLFCFVLFFGPLEHMICLGLNSVSATGVGGYHGTC